MAGYTRNQISKMLGIGNETLRYYERIGIIPTPSRTESNYRIYNENDLMRLKFIKKLKEFGCSLNEVSTIIKMLKQDRNKNDEILKKQIESKIEEIDSKVGSLIKLKEMLKNAQDYPNLGECDLLNFFYKTS